MSSFIRSAADSILPTVLRTTDQRTWPDYHSRLRENRRGDDGMLWPLSRGMGSGMSQLFGGDASNTSNSFRHEVDASGTPTRAQISGVTRDSTTNPLANCTIQVLSADGTLLAYSTTSDGNGNYEAYVEDPTLNYKVDAYKTGSPDVAGTTINTLQGT